MANYSYETLLVDKNGGILTIVLNRPERLNAIDETMHKELETVFAEVGNDPEVSAVVLTGAGRGFCSGADLAAQSGEGHPSGSDLLRRKGLPLGYHSMLLQEFPRPTVAAVNGVA